MNGQARRAAAVYEDVLHRWPGFPLAALRLAWIRAAHPDPGLRDGKRALAALAGVPTELRASRWEFLDVEAAALAETGRYEDAVRVAEAALAAAPPSARGAVAQRLAGYRQQVPFHATHPPAYR